MAVLAALLGLKPILGDEPPRDERTLESRLGVHCPNDRCVSNQPNERRHLRPRFHRCGDRLECVYCDHEAITSPTAR
jgi:aspartate carbamoyltransferase regulatory subunit